MGIKAFTSVGLPSSSKVEGRSLSAPVTSITVNCRSRPICWAARPTPCASCMVSNISWISFSISGVIFSMRFPFWRSTGSPYLLIFRTMAQLFRFLTGHPIPQHLHQVVNGRALCRLHIRAAGCDANENAGFIVEAEQFAEAKPRVEMVACPRGDQWLSHERPHYGRGHSLAHCQRVGDRVHHQGIDLELLLNFAGEAAKAFTRPIGMAEPENFRDLMCLLLIQAENHVEVFFKRA